jgi:hypothetical protein
MLLLWVAALHQRERPHMLMLLLLLVVLMLGVVAACRYLPQHTRLLGMSACNNACFVRLRTTQQTRRAAAHPMAAAVGMWHQNAASAAQ